MKVSIITVVYNNKNFIESCIQSVVNQSYKNIEHIIIDGNSNDGTIEIIKNHINSINTFVSEKDKGLYNALNKGISLATGDIIGLLHSDDLFYDSKTIECIVEGFKDSHADILYANGQYVERDNILQVKRIYKSNNYKKWFLNFGWIPLHTTIYVKKEIYDKYGLYSEDYSIASDYEISLRWFNNKKIKKKFLNLFVVKMRLGGKSTSLNLQKKKSTEDLKIIRNNNLLGIISLGFKIARKIPQYLMAYLIK